MSVHLTRLARNQVLFREVNERLREVLDETTGPTEFVCECSSETCIETVRLELPDYERIRANANMFVIVAGHEILEIEKVVYKSDGYLLVEKIEGADYAVRTDPRARAN